MSTKNSIRINVNYYKWSDSSEVDIYCTGTEYFIILYKEDKIPEDQWYIQHVDGGTCSGVILDLTVLSDEESFQQSTVWDAPLDYFLVQAIQRHIISTMKTWETDTSYNAKLEY